MYNNPNIIIINSQQQVIKENNPTDRDEIVRRSSNSFYNKIIGYTDKCYSKTIVKVKF